MIPCPVYIFLGLPCSPSNMVLNFISEVNEVYSNYSFSNCIVLQLMSGGVLGARDSAVNQVFWHCAQRWMCRKSY